MAIRKRLQKYDPLTETENQIITTLGKRPTIIGDISVRPTTTIDPLTPKLKIEKRKKRPTVAGVGRIRNTRFVR